MKRLLAMAVLLLALPWQAAFAEVKTFGRYEVHYIIFASDFLRPEIARAYGIVRANDRAVLNIAVRRLEPAGGSVPIKARPLGRRSRRRKLASKVTRSSRGAPLRSGADAAWSRASAAVASCALLLQRR